MNTINIKALSEQVSKLLSSVGSVLPDVTASDNGKVLGVVEGSWNKMDAPSGGSIDYSETEQSTGVRWIDGNLIYQRTFVLTNAVSVAYNSWATIPIEKGSIDKLVNIEILDNSDMIATGFTARFNEGNLNLNSYNSNGIMVKTITLYYTKVQSISEAKVSKKKTTK